MTLISSTLTITRWRSWRLLQMLRKLMPLLLKLNRVSASKMAKKMKLSFSPHKATLWPSSRSMRIQYTVWRAPHSHPLITCLSVAMVLIRLMFGNSFKKSWRLQPCLVRKKKTNKSKKNWLLNSLSTQSNGYVSWLGIRRRWSFASLMPVVDGLSQVA